MSEGSRRRRRRKLFRIIVAALALFLLIAIVMIPLDLIRVNRVRHRDIYRKVAAYLRNKQGVSIAVPERVSRLTLDDRNILVFGASSVVASDGETFDFYLEEKLRSAAPRTTITNCGYSGIDSFTLKKYIPEVLAAAAVKPELIIFYEGHNDYTNAYTHIISRQFDLFQPFLFISYFFSGLNCGVEKYLDLKMPILLQRLQSRGLVRISEDGYGCYDELILASFKQNLMEIIETVTSQHIFVLLVTPVGNLHAEPFGALDRVTRPYQRGMRTGDYRESLRCLTEARDAEILTFSIRAKSALLEFLRTVRHQDVAVCDLETALTTRHFGFGNDDFLDYFHFNDRSHRLMADVLYEFMLSNEEIKERLRLSGQ